MIIRLNYKLFTAVFSGLFALCIICSCLTPHSNAQNSDGTNLPVIMYHHIHKDNSALNNYVVSPAELEEDFKYLKENGYTAVLPRELYKRKALPEKPVIITFDDGFESVYHYAFPLAEKYGFKFVVAIYGKETEHFSKINDHNISYSYMTFDEIKELAESGICEIANHSYNLHNLSPRKGVKINPNETFSLYEKILINDLKKLQNLLEKHSCVEPEVFVYPYGFYCDESEKIINDMGFKTTFTCNEGINTLNKNSSFKLLKRLNRPHGISLCSLFKKFNLI